MEIYNEKITDLLNSAAELNILENTVCFSFIHILALERTHFGHLRPTLLNKVGLKCQSFRSSTNSFFDFNEIRYVGRRDD